MALLPMKLSRGRVCWSTDAAEWLRAKQCCLRKLFSLFPESVSVYTATGRYYIRPAYVDEALRK
jgi:hypothetical protein